MFTTYQTLRGEVPHQGIEPTGEQLSALHSSFAMGSDYVDFSVFGPRGRRAAKQLTYASFTFLPALGTWKKQEFAGPPVFSARGRIGLSTARHCCSSSN
eukprot:8004143-Heterocapsa_arctica.AAC.1